MSEFSLLSDLISLTPDGCSLDLSERNSGETKRELKRLWGIVTAKEFVFKLIEKGYVDKDYQCDESSYNLRLIDYELIQMVFIGIDIRNPKSELPYPREKLTAYYYGLLFRLNVQTDEKLMIEALKMGIIEYTDDTCT
jgi:hypothetical protein